MTSSETAATGGVARPARRRIPPVVWIAAGAVALRVVLLFGRGHYVAFDEGWYLLLGRNLWSGQGYTLSGLRHVALSPLFPIVSGALGRLVGDPVWAGRIVAALASGLVTVPCWAIFARLAGRRIALLGTLFVALMPSLAPFVVPYWIGWDLWVGAEPLLHLFLFTAFALLLRAWEERELGAAVGCGIAFALAYLARPEAIGSFGVAGILALALMLSRGRAETPPRADPRGPRSWTASRPWCLTACALAFVAVSTPYWLYLHDALGRWAITGRWVQVVPSVTSSARDTRTSSNRIESMLWRGEDEAYIRRLYALDATGTRLANGYWGMERTEQVVTDPSNDAPEAARGPVSRETVASRADSSVASASGQPGPSASASAQPGPPAPASERSGPSASVSEQPRSAAGTSAGPSSWPLRYAAALGVAVPWYLWVFAAVGLVWPGRERRLELEALVAIPVALTSLVIARAVALDPRTQVFIAPVAAFYAARGVEVVGGYLAGRREGLIRGERAPRLLAGVLVLSLLGTSVLRLGLSLVYGSPHHVVAAENAAVGEVIRRASPENATVVSFHPALALYADRDWRVLPMEPMERIVRYAREQPAPLLVLSVFYPPEVRPLEEPHYLIVPVPPDLPDSPAWRIEVPEPGEVLAFGALSPRE